MHLDEVEDVPSPDALAYRLAGKGSDLDAAILRELIGRPKRYGEFRPLLRQKGDHNLTVALKRLQDMGLIERTTDARREPPVHTYELTPLGIQTVLALQTIRPLAESLERFERARQRFLDAAPEPEPGSPIPGLSRKALRVLRRAGIPMDRADFANLDAPFESPPGGGHPVQAERPEQRLEEFAGKKKAAGRKK